MEYETDQQGYDDDRGYADRDRSRSPRPDLRGNGDSRMRSASPGGRDRMDARSGPSAPPPEEDEEAARNVGTNLFVTGIHPRLSEQDVTRIFEKYGEVEKCNIMRDPRSGESRGFGFVNMMSSQQADAAKEGLQGENIEGRTLSIEKARRSRPRTPTPGKYFGPPKRDDFRRPTRGGRYDDRRFDDRGGYGRRDDTYGGYRNRYDDRRYDDRRTDDRRYEDRGGGYYGRRDREDRPQIDRYASGGREDRYGGAARGDHGESRRGGGDFYERGAARGAGASTDAPAYSEPLGEREYGGGRSYEGRAPAGEDRYARR